MSLVHERTFARSRIPLSALLLAALLLVACGGEEPTPTPTATATPEPVATATPEPVAVEDTVMIEVTLEPTPITSAAESFSDDGTGDSAEAANVAVETTPVVEQGLDCAVEPNLDLAGYPELESTMGCALSPARSDPVGFNEFGPGPDFDRFMLWLSWESNIYSLLPDGRSEVFADTWHEELPEYTCNPTPREPASPPLPRRGFGKVWCENAGIRDSMGLTAVEERLCQHAVTQEFEHGRVIACFEDATIRYFKLFNDQTWQAFLQP